MKHNIDVTLRSLAKKQDLHLNTTKEIIYLFTGKSARQDVGIKSWGKIDFLRNIHKWTLLKISDIKEWNKIKKQIA